MAMDDQEKALATKQMQEEIAKLSETAYQEKLAEIRNTAERDQVIAGMATEQERDRARLWNELIEQEATARNNPGRYTAVGSDGKPLPAQVSNSQEMLDDTQRNQAADALRAQAGGQDFIINMRKGTDEASIRAEAEAMKEKWPDKDIKVIQAEVPGPDGKPMTVFGVTGIQDAKAASEFVNSPEGQQKIREKKPEIEQKIKETNQKESVAQGIEKAALDRFNKDLQPTQGTIDGLRAREESYSEQIEKLHTHEKAEKNYKRAVNSAVDNYRQKNPVIQKLGGQVWMNHKLNQAERQFERAKKADDKLAERLGDRYEKHKDNVDAKAEERQTKLEVQEEKLNKGMNNLKEALEGNAVTVADKNGRTKEVKLNLDGKQSELIKNVQEIMKASGVDMRYTDVEKVVQQNVASAKSAPTAGRGK
ncbi:MAG TPA: hypothetical protein VFT64_01140 [Rickettsiales bacterium]|nr:hypothetical protein [Rickettsiales bacterium]